MQIRSALAHWLKRCRLWSHGWRPARSSQTSLFRYIYSAAGTCTKPCARRVARWAALLLNPVTCIAIGLGFSWLTPEPLRIWLGGAAFNISWLFTYALSTVLLWRRGLSDSDEGSAVPSTIATERA